jgi:Ca-activated chloride channel family protein
MMGASRWQMVVAAALLAWTVAPQAPQVFRSTADVVPLFVTVTDKTGRLVPNLTRDDFQVFDNGKPQPVTLFDNSAQPIRLIALIDISGSVARAAPLLRQACTELILRLTPGDLARVGTIGNEVKFSPTFTRSAAELVNWLPTSVEGHQATPLWNAVDAAITLFDAAPPGRRVILVFSDGKDAPGVGFGKKYLTVLEASERAQREDVMIYGVGLRSAIPLSGPGNGGTLGEQLAATLPDPNLGRAADDTGGGYFELRGHDDLGATFARVAEELHRQYVIGFAPPARDGKVHKIEVKVRGNGMKSRTRKTYVAPAKGTSGQ